MAAVVAVAIAVCTQDVVLHGHYAKEPKRKARELLLMLMVVPADVVASGNVIDANQVFRKNGVCGSLSWREWIERGAYERTPEDLCCEEPLRFARDSQDVCAVDSWNHLLLGRGL
jgi:hypothetical protein